MKCTETKYKTALQRADEVEERLANMALVNAQKAQETRQQMETFRHWKQRMQLAGCLVVVNDSDDEDSGSGGQVVLQHKPLSGAYLERCQQDRYAFFETVRETLRLKADVVRLKAGAGLGKEHCIRFAVSFSLSKRRWASSSLEELSFQYETTPVTHFAHLVTLYLFLT
jgi:hypothetical protein